MYVYICLLLLVGRCMAVDREFACILFMCIYFEICWSPLGVFGPHFALLGPTLGLLLGPFGHLGHLGLPSTAWGDFGSKMDVLSEQMALKYATCAQKVTSRNSAPAAPAAAAADNPGKVAQEPQLPTPLHSRRGPG